MVARLVFKRSSAGKLLYVGWAATAAVTAVCYRAISSALCARGRCLPSWGRRAGGLPACLMGCSTTVPSCCCSNVLCCPCFL